jgi:hypothetical protein
VEGITETDPETELTCPIPESMVTRVAPEIVQLNMLD